MILPVEVVVSDPAAVIIEASAPSTVTALVKFEVIPAEPALTVTLDPTEVSACVISMELPLESMSTLHLENLYFLLLTNMILELVGQVLLNP